MITCPHCQRENMEGVLVCDSCGYNLWQSDEDDSYTQELSDDMNVSGIKSGWGTTTFDANTQVIFHIDEADGPIVTQPGNNFYIGRLDKSNEDTLDFDLGPYGAVDKGVSRLHAVLQRGEQNLSITDLGSANGTYVNGQRLTAETPQVLHDGDEVRLGKLTLHIYFNR